MRTHSTSAPFANVAPRARSGLARGGVRGSGSYDAPLPGDSLRQVPVQARIAIVHSEPVDACVDHVLGGPDAPVRVAAVRHVLRENAFMPRPFV